MRKDAFERHRSINLLSRVFYITTLASFHWSDRTNDGYTTQGGSFMAFPNTNDTR
ncbi:hypothetical protein DPMN_161860 [Dreissena polymorpha]|uniref:Uncharacterized protein n=1 Tax=Dreissena polymorpha TaxID=45954 RepID=A0A9D4EPK4_DREPO|nr:hypothetical protein DPMN_161860 [Dreissena polymorpha]